MSREISATGWNSTSSRQVKFRSMENFEVLSGNNKISRTTSGNWRYSNFLFFAFQILKKTTRGLDLRESKQYFSPKPLHHIHNSFWRPNEPNGRECAVPGGALHDITRGPEGRYNPPKRFWSRQEDSRSSLRPGNKCGDCLWKFSFSTQTFRNRNLETIFAWQ